MGIAFLLAGEFLGIFAWSYFASAIARKDSKKIIIFLSLGIVSLVLVLLSKKFADIPWQTIILIIYAILIGALGSVLGTRFKKEKDIPIKNEKYHGD